MAYVLIMRDVDGTHSSVYPSILPALDALAAYTGKDRDSVVTGVRYVSDFGSVGIVEQRPVGWTNRTERALAEAYDARECGTLTKRQQALLDRHGW